MTLSAEKYDGLITAMRQRLNGKRAGKYRRLNLNAIRWEIDRAIFSPTTKSSIAEIVECEGKSFGQACDQCGACCRQLTIDITQADIDREPKLAVAKVSSEGTDIATGKTVKTYQLAMIHTKPLHGDFPCPMQCGNLCTIHETKPAVCSSTPPGSFTCQYSRRQEGLPSLPRGVAA